MLTDAGATTDLALAAMLAVLAEAGTATGPATSAPHAVLADAGATAYLAPVGLLAMWTLLKDAPLDWMRRGGFRRCCRSCWDCPIHGVAAASTCVPLPFYQSHGRLVASLNASAQPSDMAQYRA